jgi:biopolymer transport protein ExbD
MAANLGSGSDRRNVNVELNIVPFIDLMSCLVAFLLVTAVWVNTARLDTKPVGRAHKDGPVQPPDPKLSVLVEADGIWVGESVTGQLQHIDGRDWMALDATLAAHKAGATFIDRSDLELAVESRRGAEVTYQDMITAMDIAHRAGFADVGITDPQGLETRPVL